MYLGKEKGDEEPYYSTKISIFSFILAGLAALHNVMKVVHTWPERILSLKSSE